MRVASVVVTYNRKKLLGECLTGLLNQSKPLDAIYIIDNNSDDGTQEYLTDQGFLANPRIIYKLLPTNTGGAGGFNAGIQLALAGDFDWLWLMDDDVEPLCDALENLLSYSKDANCIHGHRLEPDGGILEWGGMFDAERIAVKKIPTPKWKEGDYAFLEVSVGCFEGMLIATTLARKIDLPLADLFITWDDTYYGYQAACRGKVIYANVLSLKRKRNVEKFKSQFGKIYALSSFAAFFHYRNRFFLKVELSAKGYKFWVETAKILIKSFAKDLFVLQEISRLKASFKGTAAGIKYLAGKL